MTKEMDKKIAELKKYLYPNNDINYDIDKNQIKKTLYQLLRECLKERRYIIEIGAYTIDVTPKNLSVKYETEGNYNFLRIELDKVNGIDLDTIVEATNIINPILDEYDLISDEYILDISSKERG